MFSVACALHSQLGSELGPRASLAERAATPRPMSRQARALHQGGSSCCGIRLPGERPALCGLGQSLARSDTSGCSSGARYDGSVLSIIQERWEGLHVLLLACSDGAGAGYALHRKTATAREGLAWWPKASSSCATEGWYSSARSVCSIGTSPKISGVPIASAAT